MRPQQDRSVPQEFRLRSSLWHESGGLPYHWRALRWRCNLWRPFINQVGQWLDAWQPPEEQLLIVGASAGYSLSENWLKRFQRIDVLDPDPLAFWLLRRRFPQIKFQRGELDCLSSPQGLALIEEFYPLSAILFSNVIGQHIVGDAAAAANSFWKEQFLETMRTRSWASYHDVISTQRPPERNNAVRMPGDATLEQVLSFFWNGGELPVYDHSTYRLYEADTAYTVWALTPRQHHLVGWICMTVV